MLRKKVAAVAELAAIQNVYLKKKGLYVFIKIEHK